MASSDETMHESFTKSLTNYLMSLKQTVRKTDKTELRDRKNVCLCVNVSYVLYIEIMFIGKYMCMWSNLTDYINLKYQN